MKNNYDLAALALRLAGGGLMLTHGIPKLIKIFNGDWSFANPLGLGEEFSLVLTVFAEFLCALLILLGLRSKWAAVPLIITMMIAAFVVHGADPFGKKETALLYLLIYLAIFWIGSGKYSLDHVLRKKN